MESERQAPGGAEGGGSRVWITVVVVAVVLVFAAWWLFVELIAALGTCGEDSSFSEDEYVRRCGDDDGRNGEIFDALLAIGAAAAVAGVGLGAAAIVRRTWWPVLVLVVLLVVAAVGSFQVAV